MPTQQKQANPRIPRQRVLPVYLSVEEAAEVVSLSARRFVVASATGRSTPIDAAVATSGSAWTSSRQPSESFPPPATDGPLVDTRTKSKQPLVMRFRR